MQETESFNSIQRYGLSLFPTHYFFLLDKSYLSEVFSLKDLVIFAVYPNMLSVILTEKFSDKPI